MIWAKLVSVMMPQLFGSCLMPQLFGIRGCPHHSPTSVLRLHVHGSHLSQGRLYSNSGLSVTEYNKAVIIIFGNFSENG